MITPDYLRRTRYKCYSWERRRENGYSLVEVLISILILTVGVFGAAAMQLAATRTTQQSSYQTTALQLASDIADTVRIYAGNESHADGIGRILDLDYTSTPGALPETVAACYFNRCTPREFVNSEISEWKTRLATSFPAARLRICRDPNPWDDARQAYKWDCGGASDSGAPFVVKLGWEPKNPDGTPVKRSNGNFAPSVVLPVAAV